MEGVNILDLNTAEMWLYGRILKIIWTDNITNESVIIKLNIERQLLTKIQKIQLKFLEHITRVNNVQCVCVLEKINGKRMRDTPR